ncbi:hypothetical protein CHS0354_014017 [Potamilus streckersoni]|uniref:Uncharacterized protein n=1 Tax=Potamilus streckersoni TaxID=2493646 RepID=A0AAE0TL38_9BIVA|nr:hypothetical protein CHS0354_014017 [Potamilus streckersoni]
MKFCISVFLLLCLHHVLSQDRVKLSSFRLDIPFRNTSFTLVPPKTPRLITPLPIPDPFTFPTPRVRIPSLATGRPWESIRDQIIRTGVRDGPRVHAFGSAK